MLQNIIGQLNPMIQNSGLNSTESGAINQLTANAQQGNPFTGQITGFANNLLSGGGANAQAGNVGGYLNTMQSQLTPYANGSMIGNNPALKAQLDTIMSDVGNSVNGQFAAAGRDFSGANQQAYGRGVAQGIAPVLANQYNSDVANQMSAINALYNGGNTTAGLLSGMNQQGLTNQLQGVSTANDALAAQNYGPTQTLAAQSLARSIPAGALGLLAQIGIPIASLGSQSTGQSDTTKQDSPMTQFAQFGQGLGGIANVFKFLPSDRRVKQDIEQVGTLFDGTPIYSYRYIGAPEYHVGLMAQDVDHIPGAVVDFGGIKAVDYHAATEPSRKLVEAA